MVEGLTEGGKIMNETTESLKKTVTVEEKLRIEKQRQREHMEALLLQIIEECPKAPRWYLDKIAAIYEYLLKADSRGPSKHAYTVKAI